MQPLFASWRSETQCPEHYFRHCHERHRPRTVDPHGRHCDNSLIRDADLPSRFDRAPVADAAPDWRQAKPEMTQAEATNTELAPLSERLAQICRTLFLMASTEHLARLRLVQKYESREASRATLEFLRLV
jgi:hypothetical protein